MQILMVEDNPHLRALLVWQLQQAGYEVEATDTLRQAKALLQQQPRQLLIVDADPSQKASLQFCSWAHCHFELLILVLSSQSGEADLVAGLEAGADDYLIKPLSMRLLGARVASLSRRLQRRIPPTYLQFGDLAIDWVQRRVTIRGTAVELTPQEFSLLLVLVQADGSALSRVELLQRAWPDGTDNPRTVDTHILSLRKKIEVDPRQPAYIQTVRSVGYCFDLNSRRWLAQPPGSHSAVSTREPSLPQPSPNQEIQKTPSQEAAKANPPRIPELPTTGSMRHRRPNRTPTSRPQVAAKSATPLRSHREP